MIFSLSVSVRSDLVPSPPTYNTKYGYLSWEAYHNTSYYTRILPPVPADCPVPMGTKGETHRSTWTSVLQKKTSRVCPSAGKPVLPDVKLLTERFFRRQKFRPDPQGTNLMFAFMAQHFTHQFFKTNRKAEGGFTNALGHGVRSTHSEGSMTCSYLRI